MKVKQIGILGVCSLRRKWVNAVLHIGPFPKWLDAVLPKSLTDFPCSMLLVLYGVVKLFGIARSLHVCESSAVMQVRSNCSRGVVYPRARFEFGGVVHFRKAL